LTRAARGRASKLRAVALDLSNRALRSGARHLGQRIAAETIVTSYLQEEEPHRIDGVVQLARVVEKHELDAVGKNVYALGGKNVFTPTFLTPWALRAAEVLEHRRVARQTRRK